MALKMSIILVGLSHKTAPIELRERTAFDDAALPDALTHLVDANLIEEGMIVSTCNRVEILASTAIEPYRGFDRLTAFLGEYHRLDENQLRQHLYSRADHQAIHHVFRVASSLDSLVVGESQILGQVKQAYQHAVDAGTVGRVLSQLMHRAISVAKRVRTETGISHKPVSISSVAVELARKVHGDLADNTVLLVGAGEMGELAARNLMEQGAGRLILTNRTADRAESLAREFGGGVVDFGALYDVLPAADVIICSTSAPDYVIQRAETRKSLRARRRGPLLFIDISVPRNVDPDVATLDDVFLFDIDDLQSVIDSNLQEREREARAAEQIVEAEVQHFVKQLKTFDLGPSVEEVKNLIYQLAVHEYNRTRKRLGTLTPEQEKAIQEILIPALVNKLSHPVIIHLRNTAANGQQTEVLQELRKLIRID